MLKRISFLILIAGFLLIMPFNIFASTIGDFVWNDINLNGVQDPNEPGISGVNVNLSHDNSGVAIGSTTTDSNGMYLFSNLGAGDYKLKFVLPGTNWMFTAANVGVDESVDSDANILSGVAALTLAADESNLFIDAGMYSNSQPPIPEPTTIILLGVGLLGFAGVSRRKN